MERIKCLGLYQKGVLFFMTAIVLVFTVVYPLTIAKEGFAYKNAILIPEQKNSKIIYSGKIQGKQASITVHADKMVEFQYGEKTYGPYTAKKDSTAIPKDSDIKDLLTGIELRKGEEILFRGGVLNQKDCLWLWNEDGSKENIDISVTSSNGILVDDNGKVIDSMEPPVSVILDLLIGPKLTHKGTWFTWLSGVFLCIVTTISILFADELFRLRLAFLIRDVNQAEASSWEIAGRYIAWTVLPIVAMTLFIIGLH